MRGKSTPNNSYRFMCAGCGASVLTRHHIDTNGPRLRRPQRYCSWECYRAPRPGLPQPDGTVLVPLTRGKFAVIDGDDAERILCFNWQWFNPKHSRTGYAARERRNDDGPGPTRILMHREVIGAPDGAEVDHEDCDGLNNRKRNLRYSSHSENIANRPMLRNNTSGYRGVNRHKQNGNWTATITVSGRQRHLGCFASREEAARAYDDAAREAWGAFAMLNFPD